MPKNIVLLCDGTSNEIAGDRTNVLRLYGTLAKDERQLVYYDPGVGTFGSKNAASKFVRKAYEIRGLALGWGLDQNVKEAYQFLVNNYDDGVASGEDADALYLFGFSRGAYTARVLAGLIRSVGIIRPENLNLIDYAYAAFKKISNEDEFDSKALFREKQKELGMFERILSPRQPLVRCLGLFDTVGSVIEATRKGPRFRKHAYTTNNDCVQYVRHALAINERRSMFMPQLWPAGQQVRSSPLSQDKLVEQDLKEVWFTGVHSDIGGGYPESESALAKITLKWMIDETEAIGLHYDQHTVNTIVMGEDSEKRYVAPYPHAQMHESMHLGWRMAEILPHKVRKQSTNHKPDFSLLGWYWPGAKPRKIPENATIHNSVVKRMQENPSLEIPNLPINYEVE